MQKTSLSKTKREKTKKEKLFWIIFAIEGIVIFLAINFLINFGKENLIISSLALVVGLHFIPLSKVFGGKFHLYIGIWTTLIAIVGIILISKNSFNYKIINGFICVACAVSTTLCGLNLVNTIKKILNSQEEKATTKDVHIS